MMVKEVKNANRSLDVTGTEEKRRKPEYHYVFGAVGSKKIKSIEVSNKFASLRYSVHGGVEGFDYRGFESLNDDCRSVVYDIVMKMKREEAALKIQNWWRWYMEEEEDLDEPRWYRAWEFSS